MLLFSYINIYYYVNIGRAGSFSFRKKLSSQVQDSQSQQQHLQDELESEKNLFAQKEERNAQEHSTKLKDLQVKIEKLSKEKADLHNFYEKTIQSMEEKSTKETQGLQERVC